MGPQPNSGGDEPAPSTRIQICREADRDAESAAADAASATRSTSTSEVTRALLATWIGRLDGPRSSPPSRASFDRFPLRRVTWRRYYLGVASVGLCVLLGGYIEPLSDLRSKASSLLALVFCVLVMSGVYQAYSRTTVRLRDDEDVST